LRGQILAAAGDLDGAEYSLSRARIFDSKEPRILMALGSVAMNRGDVAGARTHFSEAAKIAPDDPVPWLAHGRIEMAFGDKDVGRVGLRRAIELGGVWEARAMLIADALRELPSAGMPKELLDWIERTVDDGVELRRRAELRLVAGDPAGALDDFLGSLRTSGRDVSLVAPIVRAASSSARVAHALGAVDRLVEEDPYGSAAWMVLGMLSHLIGDHEQTILGFETAEGLGAQLGVGAMAGLASAREEAGKPPTQVSAVRSKPQQDLIGQAVALLEAENWDEAEHAVAQGLLTQPQDVRLLYIMGQIYLERDGPLAAKSWVDQVIQSAPNFSPGLNLWAWVHAEEGIELEQAERFARMALNLQPRAGGYWDTLGWVLMRQGRHGEALSILDRAVRLSPNDDAVRARRDSCRSSLGGMNR